MASDLAKLELAKRAS
ncbi:hypothetical protein TIFTF001_054798 [Ficus carica]|nr:hypothetical protein TIFTF001_055567 [Ficus carica]GMN72045.1 hypothetical protein TIFTF001_051921 [Ficus carica]GMN72880.1 hypothetical protein TIFTF001_054798 [Ficus carica]